MMVAITPNVNVQVGWCVCVFLNTQQVFDVSISGFVLVNSLRFVLDNYIIPLNLSTASTQFFCHLKYLLKFEVF